MEEFGEFDPSNRGADENSDLDAFLEEIHCRRLLSYPIVGHGVHPELVDDLVVREVPFSIDFKAIDFDLDKILEMVKPGIKDDSPLNVRFEIQRPKIDFKFHYEMPEIKLREFDYITHLDIDSFRSRILTRDRIYDVYSRNNGGLLAKFSIFALNPNKSPAELIKILQERCAQSSDPNSASRKTLEELGQYVPPLPNRIK